MLTEEQQQKYLAKSRECPYCGSTFLMGSGIRSHWNGQALAAIQCDTCGKRWAECYKLVRIEEL